MNYRGYPVESDNGRFVVWIGDDPMLDSPTIEKAKEFVDKHIKKEQKEKRERFTF